MSVWVALVKLMELAKSSDDPFLKEIAKVINDHIQAAELAQSSKVRR